MCPKSLEFKMGRSCPIAFIFLPRVLLRGICKYFTDWKHSPFQADETKLPSFFTPSLVLIQYSSVFNRLKIPTIPTAWFSPPFVCVASSDKNRGAADAAIAAGSRTTFSVRRRGPNWTIFATSCKYFPKYWGSKTFSCQISQAITRRFEQSRARWQTKEI
jgi:hypothetical protein